MRLRFTGKVCVPGTLIERELPEGGAAAGSRCTLQGLKPDALTCTKCWLG